MLFKIYITNKFDKFDNFHNLNSYYGHIKYFCLLGVCTSSLYRCTLFFYKQIGTGFKEDDLETHTKFFKDHVIPQAKSYYRFDSSHEPDHWFEPIQVWEIKCADLSLSPVHRAAIGIVSFLSF